MLTTSTLRPGFLVSLKTAIVGNCRYAKTTLEGEHLTESGSQRARWETERTISDPIEYEAAKRARSKASSLIRGVCAASAFGLLCPESKAGELEQALAAARKIADEFNGAADLSRVHVYVITGRIAPNDTEAVRAINSELRELLQDMENGVKNVDAKAVREAASKAKSIGAMLTPEAAERVQAAVAMARSAARQIVKAGEQAAQDVDTATVAKLAAARTAFLDMDEAQEVAPFVQEGRAIEYEPEPVSGEPARSLPSAVELEME